MNFTVHLTTISHGYITRAIRLTTMLIAMLNARRDPSRRIVWRTWRRHSHFVSFSSGLALSCGEYMSSAYFHLLKLHEVAMSSNTQRLPPDATIQKRVKTDEGYAALERYTNGMSEACPSWPMDQ